MGLGSAGSDLIRCLLFSHVDLPSLDSLPLVPHIRFQGTPEPATRISVSPALSPKKKDAPKQGAKPVPTKAHSAKPLPAPKGEAKLAGARTFAVMRSRIVGHEEVSPDLIKPHSLNYRKHPDSQMGALRGSMDDMGWLKTVLVSKRTHTIIDGHARWEEAKRRKIMVPVTWLDLDKNEENKALALLDPITEMATRDDALFSQLLDSVQTENEEMDAVLKKMAPLKDEEEPVVSTPVTTQILTYDPNVFFPSSNKWGIPDLDPEMLYTGDAPINTWPAEQPKGKPQFYVFGEGGMDERVTGKIVTFYTDDWRFERIWSEAVESIAKLVPLKPLAFTSPDFSLWGDDPLAVQLWNIYRARWISRYWQAAGLKLIPSLATSTNTECYEFAYAGFPKRPSIMSMQMRTGGYKTKQHMETAQKELGLLIERVNPMRLVIYATPGAEKKFASWLPGGVEYIWCEDFSAAWFANGQKMKADKKSANLLKMQQGAL